MCFLFYKSVIFAQGKPQSVIDSYKVNIKVFHKGASVCKAYLNLNCAKNKILYKKPHGINRGATLYRFSITLRSRLLWIRG